MRIEKIGDARVIMSNPTSMHNYFAWPTVARLQNGKIAVVASGFRMTHVDPFGKTVISYSEDEGETYTAPAPIFDTVLDDRDGGIATFGTDGVIVTSFNDTLEEDIQSASTREYQVESKQYCLAYSELAATKQQKATSNFRISRDGGVSFGPIFHSPITSPHGPVELQDGTILWVGTMFRRKPEEPEVQAYKILPDGSMEYVGAIDALEDEDGRINSAEPYAFQRKDGTILCHIRAGRFQRYTEHIFTIYQTESTDGGKSWSKPHPIAKPLSGAPAHIMEHSSGVLVSVCGDRRMPGGVRVMLSEDGGKSWDTETILYREEFCNHDFGYPSTVELKDGSLLTVFYGHVDDGSGCADPGADTPAVVLQQKWRLVKE